VRGDGAMKEMEEKSKTRTSMPSPQDHYRRRVAVTILEAELAAER
jgi:hypothetical protein